MKEEQLLFRYRQFDSIEDLSEGDQKLFKAALEARLRAYAPYSNYLVGAALRLDDGTIVTGNNQENAAYPSGLCAERVAIFSARAQFPERTINELVIVTDSGELNSPASPCGSCRQVLVEFENNQSTPIRLLLCNTKQQVIEIQKAGDLLPLCFTCEQLNS